jgi:hypothetical protein
MYILDNNEQTALISALDNYLNGLGMEDGDEDESVLETLVAKFNGGVIRVSD